jgi:CBS domain-containing protein
VTCDVAAAKEPKRCPSLLPRSPSVTPVATEIRYVTRILRLPLVDADGEPVGAITDIIIGQRGGGAGGGPTVRGFIATVQRRPIFVVASRIGWLDARGVQLATGTVDLRQFRPRGDELLAKDLIGRSVGGETVSDIGLASDPDRSRSWTVVTVALRRGGVFGVGGRSRIADWSEVGALFETRPLPEDVRDIEAMRPADAARRLFELPAGTRASTMTSLDDHTLAQILQELPEPAQAQLLGELDLVRAADVIEEMAPDDATDLLAELTLARRVELLDEIDPVQGVTLRRLLGYGANTAGGLMTSDPIILAPNRAVADALARIRNPEVIAALAAQVFVTESPTQTPTGRYLGSVSFQRLLREPPGTPISECTEVDIEPVTADMPDLAVARRLAAYNLLALPVCDAERRLLGAVTVDDVLDRSLPSDWRQR